MKIKQFFASLLPSFGRDQISEDIEALSDHLKSRLVPSLKTAATVQRGKGFKSKVAQNFDGVFAMTLPQYKRHGFIEGTYAIFNDLQPKLSILETYVSKEFNRDVTKDAMTYRKAAVLRYLEIANFATEYASRSLLRFLAAESAAVLGDEDKIDAHLAPNELKWLSDNQNAYLKSLVMLSYPTAQAERALENIPDITIVEDKVDVVTQTVGADKLDPFKMGLISANWNPIYHVRMVVAEYQTELYKARVEEKRALEFRILQLKKAYEGNRDAALQKQIDYNEGRLETLKFKLAQTAERYA